MAESIPDRVRAWVVGGLAPSQNAAEELLGHMRSVAFPTIESHLIQRVADRQWAPETTIEQFRADIDQAITRASRLALYPRRGGLMTATITETDRAVAASRAGRVKRPWTLVVYSADRDILVTGYQFSSMGTIWVPEDAIWVELQP